MTIITCADLPSPEACCRSCHDDADEGYDLCMLKNELDELWSAPTRQFERLWESYVCCTNVSKLSRPQLAQALRTARARR